MSIYFDISRSRVETVHAATEPQWPGRDGAPRKPNGRLPLMTDGPDRIARMRGGADADASVESLASRALSVLASKRVTAAYAVPDGGRPES